MHAKKFSPVTILILFAAGLLITLFMMNPASQSTQVASAGDDASRFEMIYEELGHGTALVRRVPLPAAPVKAPQACTQPPPVLLEPADEAQIDTLIPDYQWVQVSSDVYRYSFELSRDPDFVLLDDSVTLHIWDPVAGNITRLVSFDNLIPDTIYYWRVASRCEDTGEPGAYSTPFWFRSAASGGVILSAPNQIAPQDGASTGSIMVNFFLGDVPGALHYQFRFYDTPTDEWDYWYMAVRTWDPDTVEIFDPETTVYWRGAAQNSYAVGVPSGRRSFTTPPVVATTEINPGTGGSLTPDPGNISLQFPPGAVSAETTITYTLQPEPNYALANFRFAGRAFTLEASDANGPVTTFDQPYTLTIVYDSWDLFAAGIGNPARLNLLFWNGSAWEEILPCAGCSVDTANHTVTVVLNHFTEFALVGPLVDEDTKKIYLPVTIRQ